MSTCSEYYDQIDKILVRVLPTQLLAHATQQTRTMYAYVYQCTKLRRPKQIWFTYVRSGIAARILVEIRLRLDLGSAWSVWRYSNAQVRSLTARELPQQYKGCLVYCISLRKISNGNVNVKCYYYNDVVLSYLRTTSQNNFSSLTPLHVPTDKHDIIMHKNIQKQSI